MFVARWQIDAKFGQKQAVIDSLKKWEREVGSKAGTDKMDFKVLTGSIGAREATVMQQIARGYSDQQINLMADYFSRRPR
jgi:hypothetical protein